MKAFAALIRSVLFGLISCSAGRYVTSASMRTVQLGKFVLLFTLFLNIEGSSGEFVRDETTIGDMYRACDSLLSGDWAFSFPDACRVAFLVNNAMDLPAAGACPPPRLTPEMKAYAFVKKYIETNSSLPTNERTKFNSTTPWQPFAAAAIAARWPCGVNRKS